MTWFRSPFRGGNKPESTSLARPELIFSESPPAPPPAAPGIIRLMATSTTGRETTVGIHPSAVPEEPLLSIQEIAAAERKLRTIARVPRVLGKHFSAHVDEIQALRRAEQYDEALVLFECITVTERAVEIEGHHWALAYAERALHRD